MIRLRAVSACRWAVIVGVVVALPLEAATADGTHRWTVAAYLSGDGDLRASAHRYLEMVAEGTNRRGWAAAAQIDETAADGECQACRYAWTWQEEERRCSAESVPGRAAGVNMGEQGTLGEFLRWARQTAPAERYALIIMGHGTGLAASEDDASGGLTQSGVALDTSAEGDCLTAEELAAGIEEGFEGAGDEGLEVLFLDCCYGGSLEVAHELRGAVRYMTGAPGEIPNPGLPWTEILSRAGRSEQVSGREIVQTCLKVVAERNAARAEDITLTAVDVVRMGEASERLGAFVKAAVPQMTGLAPTVTLAHSGCATWGSQREFCDAVGLLDGIADEAEDESLAKAARSAAETVRAGILGQVGEAAEAHGGIAIFFPGKLSEVPSSYHRDCGSFTAASGWEEFLECYLHRLRDLMGRTVQREQTEGSGAASSPQG